MLFLDGLYHADSPSYKSLKGTGTAGTQEVQGVIPLEAEVAEVELGAPSPVITQCLGVHL